MKKITIILIAYILSGCSNEVTMDPRLYGVWVSDKDKTLSEIGRDSKLSQEKMEFLEANLGDLTFIFKGSKVAVQFVRSPEIQPEYESYEIKASNHNSVSIKTSHNVEATYYFEGNCFYLETHETWGYREYFCKK